MSDKIFKALEEKFQFIANLDYERHLFKVPVSAIEFHDDFQAIRAKSPEDISLLRDSYKRTGESIYTPCVYAEIDAAGEVHIYVVDGHQRIRAALEKGQEHITVQWISRWKTPKQAMEGAMDLQFARYDLNDADVISILRRNLLTVAEVAELTGKGETTVRRMKVVADYQWLDEPIKEGAITYNIANKLIEKCGNNPTKLSALKKTLEARFHKAQVSAKEMTNKIKANRKKKWDRKTREKAKVASYFKGEDWELWETALDLEQFKNGELDSGVEKADAAPVRIGDDSEWGKEFALYGLFGQPHSKVLMQDLKDVIESWDDIGQRLKAILKRRVIAESIEDVPMPSKNPITTDNEPPKGPTKQDAEFGVEDEIG